VHIELASTLTREDENKLAQAVLKAVSGMLDMLPIAYVLRVETVDQSLHQMSDGAGPRPTAEITAPSEEDLN
jgi:hypothetical protein